MKDERDIKPKSKCRSLMLKNGKVRKQRFITSTGHVVTGAAQRALDNKDMPYTRWPKAKIKKVFTDKYVDDLVRRARENMRAPVKLSTEE